MTYEELKTLKLKPFSKRMKAADVTLNENELIKRKRRRLKVIMRLKFLAL